MIGLKRATTELLCTFADAGLRQQLSHSYNGGWPDQALQWAVKTGQTSDASYPYKMVKGSCSAQKAAVNIDGYVTLADSASGIAGNTVTLLKVGLLQLLTYKLQSSNALSLTSQTC